MLNSVSLVGRLTRDPEIKTLTGGATVGTFTLAVQRNKEEVDFVPCEVWGKTAESVGEYVTKGALIGIEGKIKVENYEVEGVRRTFTKVVCHRTHFIDLRTGDRQSTRSPINDKGPADFMTDQEKANEIR